ncbi:MAG: hypothetical protein EHJ95_02820 [Methanobacteriota archaeon]|nr:MAG: hypothetical protein EHJ95_02820 [Euryarchaeota archaeon]
MKEPKAILMDSMVPLVGTIATIRMKTNQGEDRERSPGTTAGWGDPGSRYTVVTMEKRVAEGRDRPSTEHFERLYFG